MGSDRGDAVSSSPDGQHPDSEMDQPGGRAPDGRCPGQHPEAQGAAPPGLFSAPGFTRLWIAQVVSSFGDWIGLLAIIEVARRIGGDQPGSAIALVVTARVLPGFFLASAGGIIVDRFNRKRLLVICDIVRASVLLTIPFIDRVWGLVLASLVLELATSLWSPAKEAIVPNIVPTEHLTAANSLGLVAAYGTFPLGAGAFALMAKLGELIGWTDIGQVEMSLVVDSATFLVAAAIIATLPLSSHITAAHRKRDSGSRINWGQGFRELREGWDYIAPEPTGARCAGRLGHWHDRRGDAGAAGRRLQRRGAGRRQCRLQFDPHGDGCRRRWWCGFGDSGAGGSKPSSSEAPT